MSQEVHINGFTYYADVNNQILYENRDKKSGSPFTFLSKNDKQQLETELRFPRKSKKENI